MLEDGDYAFALSQLAGPALLGDFVDQDISLLDAIYTTRAIRKFKPEPVPLDLIAKVLDAAIQAPSGVNQQPWRFVVVTDAELKEKIADFYRDSYFGRRRGQVLDEKASSSVYMAKRFGEAPVHILVCGPDNHNATPNNLSQSVPAAVFPAIQNLLLVARVYGLGGVLTINHEPFTPQIRELLGIPSNYYIYAVVPMGFSAQKHGPKTRKPVSEVSFLNAWGKSLGEA